MNLPKETSTKRHEKHENLCNKILSTAFFRVFRVFLWILFFPTDQILMGYSLTQLRLQKINNIRKRDFLVCFSRSGLVFNRA